MTNKKAQIHILESVGVIIFFSIIAIFFFIFYVRYQSQETQNQKEENMYKLLMEKVKALRSLEELKCTILGVEGITCIDYMKLLILRDIINTNEFAKSYYAQFFGSSEIIFEIVYAPYPDKIQNITLFKQDDANYKNQLLFYQPFTVYDANTKKYYFAMMKFIYKYN
ncbi:MAG: hypothetical protein QXS41_02755 [Candidatus Woesearchaeota archaeon]